MRRLLFALALLAGLASAGSPAFAQNAADDSHEHARRRWDAKSPEERAVLRERFRELQKMTPEERGALAGLAQRLKEREEELGAEIPVDVRSRLAELTPSDRRGVVREHLRDVLRREGEDVMERLPRAVVDELEALPPRRRPLKLETLLRKERPLGAADVRRIGADLGATPDELRELDTLDAAQLQDRALRFHRRALDRRVAELGLPPGIDAEGYAELRALPHAEFFRRWRRLDPTEAYGRPPRDERPPGAAGPQPGPTEDARRRAMLLDRARRLLAPTFEERVEFAGADAETRSAALRTRARERCLAYLAEHALLTPEQLADLRAADGQAFEGLAHRALRGEMDRCVGKRSRLRDRFRERWDERRDGRER